MTLYLTAAFEAYLLGSIPWGFLAGRINGVDLRKQGSGSTGATNALRILGKKWGYTVFALDAFKGWLAVMIAFFVALKSYQVPQAVVINAGVVGAIFAMIGHTYPFWLRFQGGKGIATAAGIMLALFPPQDKTVSRGSLSPQPRKYQCHAVWQEGLCPKPYGQFLFAHPMGLGNFPIGKGEWALGAAHKAARQQADRGV